jgi:uncharacterized protein YcfL
MVKVFIVSLIILVCSGCASAVSKQQSLAMELNMPIDCKLADSQIMALQDHRITKSEVFTNTIAIILPTSAIANLLLGEYSSRAALANGEFNQSLDERILMIKEECKQQQS